MAAAASKAGKAKSTLIPLGDRVVVEREESEQTTSGGILLPDSAKDKPARGVVVSVGEGKLVHTLLANGHPAKVERDLGRHQFGGRAGGKRRHDGHFANLQWLEQKFAHGRRPADRRPNNDGHGCHRPRTQPSLHHRLPLHPALAFFINGKVVLQAATLTAHEAV